MSENNISNSGRHLSPRSVLLRAAAAWCSAAALCLDFHSVNVEESHIHNAVLNGIYKLLEQLSASFQDKGLVLLVLAAALSAAYVLLPPKGILTKVKGDRALAAIFALLYTGSRLLYEGEDFSALIRPLINVPKALIMLAGTAFLFLVCVRLYCFVLDGGLPDPAPRHRIPGIFTAHPGISLFACILVFWLPHLILRYPGAMSYDNWNQLAYYYGDITYTTAQPIFHTWLFGSFIRLGKAIHSAGLGLFLFILFQDSLMAAALSDSLLLMKQWRSPRWLGLFTLIMICFGPYYAGYAAFPIKDYLYTAGLLFWVLCILRAWTGTRPLQESGPSPSRAEAGSCGRYVQAPGSFRFLTSRRDALLWVLGSLLMILCRKNGIYVYVPTTAVFVLALLVRARRGGRQTPAADAGTVSGSGALMHLSGKEAGGQVVRQLLLAFAVCALPLVISKAADTAIRVHYHVVQDSPKEAFCLPFQQTARTVRDFPDDLSQEEHDIIGAVIDVDRLDVVYCPDSADDVKSTFHADSTQQLIDYLRVWIKMFFRHPVTYLEATWVQNCTAFLPEFDMVVFNQDCNYGIGIMTDSFLRQIDMRIPDALQGAAITICSFYEFQMHLPVTGRLNNVAVTLYTFFALLFYLRHRKGRRSLLPLLPGLLTFAFILLGPVIDVQPRYAFPILYCLPVWTAYAMRELHYA